MSLIKKVLVAILTIEARILLRKRKPFIVAVTGSVGKTSTKDAIYDVLCSPGTCNADGTGICHVRKSEKSMNSEIGLPLTILGVPNAWYSISGWFNNVVSGINHIFSGSDGYPDCLVLEIGADHPGDIRKVAKWLKPDIAVLTKISRMPVHVEFFSSPEEVFEEKAYLAKAVKPGGALVLFGDDEKTLLLGTDIGKANAGSGKDEVRVLTYGISNPATVRAIGYSVIADANTGLPSGFSFDLDISGETRKVTVSGVLGKGHLYSMLAAATVGKARRLKIDQIAAALSSYSAPKGRMNILQGVNGSVILDDTYNSSPDAALAALETLGSLESRGRKIAVLGDMMELGKYSGEEHLNIGVKAAEVLAASGLLITVGQRSKKSAEGALSAGMSADKVHSTDSSKEAGELLRNQILPGDIILVKGSQAVRTERVVSALLAHSEKSADLLVRQEKEWLEKK